MKRTDDSPSKNTARYKYFLALAALGVVYGDIGTSPLYALKEAFHPGHNMLAVPENILGLLSLIFWSLTLVISVKYITFIMRADNRGEGGILALTSLILPRSERGTQKMNRSKRFLILLGLFGTALLFGDGMITPAISILSAVEGLSLITPIFNPYILPITIGILVALFSIQRKGTGTVGKIFGPVTLLWFLVIAALGTASIFKSPEILIAINPIYIISFFQTNAWFGFVVLGSVFLVVTGGEALFSDLGHFGLKPIKQAWFYLVFPSLVLNYFGQGALLLRNPAAISNPFFLLAPEWALYPLVILATVATTVASQALITGVFSITMQAVQNGYFPRLQISHTSKDEFGQIYIKSMNQFLLVGAVALVVAFKSSSNLAAAYGLAVTTTMVITTLLFYVVARERWRWSRLTAGSLCAFFLIIDLGFWSSNLLKIVEGGWFPVLVGIAGFTLMTTWKSGRRLLMEQQFTKIMPLTEFLERIELENPPRIASAAVYLNRNMDKTPYSLIHSYEHFKSLHRHLIFLSVKTEDIPRVAPVDRMEVERLSEFVFKIYLHYGYLEQPDVPSEINNLQLGELKLDTTKVSFMIGKETIHATDFPGMALWREKLFSVVAKNELSATEYFRLPRDRVVEIGVQLAI